MKKLHSSIFLCFRRRETWSEPHRSTLCELRSHQWSVNAWNGEASSRSPQSAVTSALTAPPQSMAPWPPSARRQYMWLIIWRHKRSGAADETLSSVCERLCFGSFNGRYWVQLSEHQSLWKVSRCVLSRLSVSSDGTSTSRHLLWSGWVRLERLEDRRVNLFIDLSFLRQAAQNIAQFFHDVKWDCFCFPYGCLTGGLWVRSRVTLMWLMWLSSGIWRAAAMLFCERAFQPQSN